MKLIKSDRILVTVLAVIIVSLLSIPSCKRDKLKEQYSNKNYGNKDYLISEKCAIAVAKHINVQQLSRSSSPIAVNDTFQQLIDKTIDSIYTVTDTNNIAAFYVFSYHNDGGWLILSADVRMEPVLAYNTEGNFFRDDNIPAGLGFWFDKTIDNIEKLRDNTYNNTTNGTQAWYEFINYYNLQTAIATLVPASLTSPPSIPPCPNGYFTVGPLLKATWGQTCTYNDALNSCSNTTNCNHVVTGCVATATSQILHYWGQPSSIWNFNAMAKTHGDISVQSLMSDVGNNVSMSYGCTSSSATTQHSRNAIVNTYNYGTAVHKNYSKSDMFADIISNRPGMLGGCSSLNRSRKHWWQIWKVKYTDCHQWCYDGVTYWNNCGSITYDLVHMNWGWHEVYSGTFAPRNNDHNGWFNYNDWTITGTGINFKYADDMVGNIHP